MNKRTTTTSTTTSVSKRTMTMDGSISNSNHSHRHPPHDEERDNSMRTANSSNRITNDAEEEKEEEGDNHDSNDNDDDDDDGHDDNNNGSNDDYENNGNKQDVVRVTESELVYSIESFRVVFLPVSISMTLSALAVVFLNTPESIEAGEQAYASAYNVFTVDTETQSNAQNLGASVANTLIIVSVIGVMTFIVVLLYKYRCLKFLYGYLIVATALLLGYFTTSMVIMFVQIYGWFGRGLDKLSLALIMYNYSAVGVVAIFYGKGMPRWVPQGYLIGSSVAVAWRLSYFDDWMAWTLLVMLALYDLFAVLSPCGPLKALAEQISKPGAPSLPGLLYEAALPSGVRKPKASDREETPSPSSTSSEDEPVSEADNGQSDSHDQESVNNTQTPRSQRVATSGEDQLSTSRNETAAGTLTRSHRNNGHCTRFDSAGTSSSRQELGQPTRSHAMDSSERVMAHMPIDGPQVSVEPQVVAQSIEGLPQGVDMSNTAKIPLALAKMYRLSIIDDTGALRKNRFATTWQRYYTSDEIRGTTDGEQVQWTSKHLRSEIIAIMPPRGGRIEKCPSDQQKYEEGKAYHVYSRHGDVLRKLVVTKEGDVMEVVKRETNNSSNESTDDDDEPPGTIKLGLGDFVFYSILVSKAAQYSFTAFASCHLMILFGLSMTLIILAINGKALPALPISILLGVVAFVWTRWSLEPFLFSLLDNQFYV